MDFAQTIGRWHDFYMLTGTAAATLIGLMFIAVSFAVGSKAERTRRDLDAFVTPSLVYFAEVFVIAGTSLAPLSARTLGTTLCALLMVNLPFGLWRLRYLFNQHKAEALPHQLWIWQVLLPILAQLVLGAGGYGLLVGDDRALRAIAISLTMLLVIAVRNAWYLVIWLIEQR